jgi:hypothetical protein
MEMQAGAYARLALGVAFPELDDTHGRPAVRSCTSSYFDTAFVPQTITCQTATKCKTPHLRSVQVGREVSSPIRVESRRLVSAPSIAESCTEMALEPIRVRRHPVVGRDRGREALLAFGCQVNEDH